MGKPDLYTQGYLGRAEASLRRIEIFGAMLVEQALRNTNSALWTRLMSEADKAAAEVRDAYNISEAPSRE